MLVTSSAQGPPPQDPRRTHRSTQRTLRQVRSKALYQQDNLVRQVRRLALRQQKFRTRRRFPTKLVTMRTIKVGSWSGATAKPHVGFARSRRVLLTTQCKEARVANQVTMCRPIPTTRFARTAATARYFASASAGHQVPHQKQRHSTPRQVRSRRRSFQGRTRHRTSSNVR